MNKFNENYTLGDIVAVLPKASEIFKKYRIDFCCGGHRPLSEALKELNLDELEVLNKLNETYEEMKDFNEQVDFVKIPPTELIDYIINKHHTYLKRALPELSELTTTILRVHGPSHSELFKVHKLFHNLKMELDQHLIKEEEILFPLIKDYDVNPSSELLGRIDEVMKETEDEHETAGDVLKELRKITDNYQLPEGACGTYYRTFDLLQEFEGDLFEHIHLENNILFKRLVLQVSRV